MENCLVTNFYRAIFAIASYDEDNTQTSSSPQIVGFNRDIISPQFIATSITTFAITFALFSIYFVTTRVWRISKAAYELLFVPYDRIMPLGSVGYMNHESYELSQKQLVNMTRKRRKLGLDVPPVYPNGWFRILDSGALKIAEVKQVRIFGENLVAFRGNSGKVSVLDAYCTHMGANLAVGGRVLDDCIECPFHAWKFDGEGKCVDVPYAEKLPKYADTKAWPTRELNGNIYVWFHCDKIEPEWELPHIPEIQHKKYEYGGRTEHHVNTHIQDIPENGYDEPHLQHLHLPFCLSGVNLATQFDSKFNIADNVMKTDYSEMFTTGERHIAKIGLNHSFAILKRWNVFHLNFQVYQVGPGVVHIFVSTPLFHVVIVQNITPVEPMEQVMTHSMFKPWYIPNIVAKAILFAVAIQVDRDLMVWNNRTILGKPLLQKEEKVQKTFRRWYAQFYSENSPRLGDRRDSGVVKQDNQKSPLL